MCELLVFAQNNNHDDPSVDRARFKRGQVVVVMPDGHQWGAAEGLPTFVKVKIPGVSVAKARSILETQMEDDAGAPAVDADGRPLEFRVRAWQLAVASIPAAIRNTLLTTGEFTVTVPQIRAYLRRIRDNAQFTGLD